MSAFVFSSCLGKEDPIFAQTRLRKIQSRVFVGHTSRSVAKEVIQVLQDSGYAVKSVSADIGLITAELSTNIETFRSKFWSYLFSGRKARWKKHAVIAMTTSITEGQNQAKVRVNYCIRIYDNLGRLVDVHQVLEGALYIDFFNRMQRVMLEKEALAEVYKAT